MFLLFPHIHNSRHFYILIFCRRIKHTEKSPHDQIKYRFLQSIQFPKLRELTGRNDRIVVCHFRIIGILRSCNISIQLSVENLLHKIRSRLISPQTADIFMDFLCHRSGEHTRIGTRIRCQFPFIQILRHL